MGGENEIPKIVYFFDSHGALWEALDGTEGYDGVAAFGPTGIARGVNARLFYEVRVGETDYAAANRLGLLAKVEDSGWEFLNIPKDEGPIDLKLKGGRPPIERDPKNVTTHIFTQLLEGTYPGQEKNPEEMISVPRSLLQRAAASLHDAYDGGEWFAAMPEDVPWAAAKEATEGLEIRDEIRDLLKK